MPILNIQRRMAEQGRIRLGQKVAAANGKTRPDKLDRFRFTSPNRGLIEQIAAKYGGHAHPWDNAGKSEWEVISDARSIPVIVVKGGFSQWHELWSKAGCLHRCDGEKDVTGQFCDPDDPQHREAIEKPTTRLSVMLSEIETLGVWRMESKGWNAAAELPSMAELAMHVGDLVPATLSLAERSAIIEGRNGPQTSRFVVPVLDLHVTKARLVELVGGLNGAPALTGGAESAPAAIASAPHQPYPTPGYGEQLVAAVTVEQCQAIWRQAGQAGHLDDELKAVITSCVERIKAADTEPVDGEIIDEGTPHPIADDVDTVWQALVTECGRHGVADTDMRHMLEQEYAQPIADLTAEQLQATLDVLRKMPVSA